MATADTSDSRKIFKKVNLSEKRALFRLLPQVGSILLIKGEEDHLFRMISFEVDKEAKALSLAYPKNEPVRMSRGQAVIINFEVNEDRYFFTTNVSVEENKMIVDLIPDLFVLQRRKTARVDIPANYPHHARILEYLGKAVFVEGQVMDVSSGGCRICIPKKEPAFHANQEVKISLQFSFRNAIDLKAVIRHTFASEDPTSNSQIFGLQFTNLTSTMENRLIMLFMDIQREIFLKFSS